MLTYYNNYVPLVQLKTINMPRQARKTSGTGIYHVISSRWDRYLGMTAAMTQVPVPVTK